MLGSSSEIARESTIQLPQSDEGPAPQYVQLRFRIGGDAFTRVWQLGRLSPQGAVYRFIGDSSRSFPGAYSRRVDDLGSIALDITDVMSTVVGVGHE